MTPKAYQAYMTENKKRTEPFLFLIWYLHQSAVMGKPVSQNL